jgi:hypothetical protein
LQAVKSVVHVFSKYTAGNQYKVFEQCPGGFGQYAERESLAKKFSGAAGKCEEA